MLLTVIARMYQIAINGVAFTDLAHLSKLTKKRSCVSHYRLLFLADEHL